MILKFDNNFPIIDINSDIFLREIILEDAIYYYEYLNHLQVKKFLSNEYLPNDLSQAVSEMRYWKDLFRNNASIFWGMALKNNNQLIGTFGFNNWIKYQSRAEISYDLDYNYWNQGLATQAIKSICDYAFKFMQVIRIQATVANDNFSSIKVLEKNFFSLEGTLKQYARLENQQKDFYMYSLITNN